MLDDPVVSIQNRIDRSVMPVQWMSEIRPVIDGAWRIKNRLPKQGIACIYGASGSSKTFLTLDIAAHIAAGMDWGECKTEQGLVVYLAAESPTSLLNRVSLWRDTKGPDADVPLAIIPKTLNLISDEDAAMLVEWLAVLANEHGPIAAVVIDTLARVMGSGDENKAIDMGKLITYCDRIRERFGTLVILVHHSGKNAEAGARGSSALRAGVDTEIEVVGSDGQYRASWEKQRDGAIGFHYQYRLESHAMGEDEDGDPVTSCLVEELTYVGEKKARQKKLTPTAQAALNTLNELLDGAERIASPAAMTHGARQMQTVASVEDWRQLCYDRDASDRKDNARRMAFNRAVDSLKAAGKVQVFRNEAWLCD